MKKLLSTLILTLLTAVLLFPVLAIAETAITEITTAESAPTEIEVTVPVTGYDWSSLASITGATAFTLLFVQFVKAPLDKLWHIPTRVVVYLIAFITLLLAQVFTVGFALNSLLLTAMNAVIAGSAAMGAYEMTFAKADMRNSH